MNKGRILLFFLCLLFLFQGLYAQRQYRELMWGIGDANYGIFDDNNPHATVDMLNHIRQERFYLILPRVMREKKIDMWIHVIRPWSWGGTDPLRYEFGSKSGVFIFTDRGGDRIERVVFEGEVVDPDAYDIVRGPSKFVNQENYEIMDYVAENPDKVLESELDLRFVGLRDFVAERNPKRIAVNYIESLSLSEGSETFTMALTDGISYTDYLQLVKALGDEYAKRMVSAEYLILDYLSRRVAAEVVLYGTSGNLRRRARKFDKIVPGVTTLSEIGARSVINKAGRRRNNGDYVIQRGDYISGWGRKAYVLQKGETDLPPYIRKFWDDVEKIRDILRKNIKVGPTAGETLELLIRKLEEEGYVHHHRQIYDRYLNPEKTQVAIDCHAEGKGILAPRISNLGPKWHWDIKIPLFHTFAIEYFVYMAVPEWDKANNSTGQRLYVMFHDGGIVTERGMEIAYPEQSREIQIIQ
jgi:CRISPR/Cas system-associated endoribonuclease Cas2